MMRRAGFDLTTLACQPSFLVPSAAGADFVSRSRGALRYFSRAMARFIKQLMMRHACRYDEHLFHHAISARPWSPPRICCHDNYLYVKRGSFRKAQGLILMLSFRGRRHFSRACNIPSTRRLNGLGAYYCFSPINAYFYRTLSRDILVSFTSLLIIKFQAIIIA